jgi:hypothetical protein
MDKGIESYGQGTPAWGGGVGAMPHIGDEAGGWRSVGDQQQKGAFESAQTQALFGSYKHGTVAVRGQCVGLGLTFGQLGVKPLVGDVATAGLRL